MTTELSLSVIGNLDKARALVKEANLTQAKEIISEAEALRTYAEQANKGLEIQNQCAEIKIRAERRAGELLKRLERATPQTAKIASTDGHDTAYGSALKELKTTRQDAQRWQLEATIPEEKFEQFITEMSSHKLVMSATEAARKLGIGVSLMYAKLRDGTIPHVKLGDRYLISKTVLDRWLTEQSFKKEGN